VFDDSPYIHRSLRGVTFTDAKSRFFVLLYSNIFESEVNS
jgi:hypothetical protein